ncbi:hypothetical protein NIE88_04335 [Sporolactobacillus shoreicorticis]|uniref:Uncharacterized protein n=1 Tax=Sporolactobacillus shoreicorticis TaxID=1923877 RepID=A0ABW5RYS5_9BACL|nr:hypothetical protein [Sporolactobacillus shoreicorticis]MCO7125003.1 hypothetical protein [Sporolactobacillus shoreicorticis]
MTTQTNDLQIDDYLDLYLYAKQLHDDAWQAEIKAKLIEYVRPSQLPAVHEEKELQEQFTYVNRQILHLYRSLRTGKQELNDAVTAELFVLKHRRIELGKEIDRLRIQNQRICK